VAAVVADTHAAVWYLLQSPNISQIAVDIFDKTTQSGDLIYLSSISLVEVTYLVEKRRLPEVALDRLNAALQDLKSSFVLFPIDLGVAQSVRRISRDVVPDMPDRIIAATPFYPGLPLVTRDRNIQASGIATIW
jgi:PIN domain nuclease of toxin-antitoxin system